MALPLTTTEAISNRRTRAAPLQSVTWVVLLLLVYGGLATSAGWRKSPTFDEPGYLTAGYAAWHTGDFRLMLGTGMMPQRWPTIPLLWEHCRFPTLDQPAWWGSNVWGLHSQFLYPEGNDPERMLLYGRVMVTLLGAALGALVYGCSRSLFGRAGALVSLMAFVFCPNMLAHGNLVTADLSVTLFFMASVWFFWRVLHRVAPVTVAASSLALAGLFLSKMSSFLIVPMLGLLLVIRLCVGRPLRLASGRLVVGRWRQVPILAGLLLVHGIVMWSAIWLTMDCRYSMFRDAVPGRDQIYPHSWDEVMVDAGRMAPIIQFGRQHHVLPEAFLYGFAYTLHSTQARPAFWNGEINPAGWRLFFPYCVLVKTPIPQFALLALGAVAVVGRRRASRAKQVDEASRNRDAAYGSVPFWVLLAVYGTSAVLSHINIGLRHVLPIYPSLFILAGSAGWWCEGVSRRFTQSGLHAVLHLGTLLALVLLVLESFWTWPSYLSYFNLIAGGSAHGYEHLVDSSLDWGQDLPGLKKWLEAEHLDRPGRRRVYLSYFGSADPEHYGIVPTYLPCFFSHRAPGPPRPLAGGVYCISATMLQCVYLQAPGPWNRIYEAKYRQLHKWIADWEQARDQPKRRQALLKPFQLQDPEPAFVLFEDLRFSRLCASLRRRSPDHQVNGSILIYELDDADVERALYGSAPG